MRFEKICACGEDGVLGRTNTGRYAFVQLEKWAKGNVALCDVEIVLHRHFSHKYHEGLKDEDNKLVLIACECLEKVPDDYTGNYWKGKIGMPLITKMISR